MSSSAKNTLDASVRQDSNSPNSEIAALTAIVGNLCLVIADMSAKLGAISPPAIVPDGLYRTDQIEGNLAMSNVTLSEWREFNGLPAAKPGTNKFLFYGQDVIDFVRQHADGNLVKPKTSKAKAAARKKTK